MSLLTEHFDPDLWSGAQAFCKFQLKTYGLNCLISIYVSFFYDKWVT